jgi:hypothetical protein
VVSGKFYEGRIVGDVVVAEDLQGPDRPIPVQSSVELKVSNIKSDGTIGYFDELFKSFDLYNAPVTSWLGDGIDKSDDFEQQFKGVIRFPDGVKDYSTRTLTIEVTDIRQRDETVLPRRKFTTELFPNLEAKSQGKAIPLIYGDWGNIQVGSSYYPRVQAVCIDTTQNLFKLCDAPIQGIDGIYRNGVKLVDGSDYDSNDFDLRKATFKINTYDEDADTISVDCRGICYGDDPNDDLIENPVDVLTDLIHKRAGKASSFFDGKTMVPIETTFADNFNDQDLTGWSGNIGSYSAANGYLERTEASGTTRTVYAANTNFDNVEVSFRVKLPDSGNGLALQVFLGDNAAKPNGYGVRIRRIVGTKYTYIEYVFGKFNNYAVSTVYRTVNTDSFDTNWHNIRFTRSRSGSFTMTIDGTTFPISTTDTSILSCDRIYVTTFLQGHSVDDIKIRNYNASQIHADYEGFRCRRFIDQSVSLSSLVSELCFETGIVPVLTEGLYGLDTFFPDYLWPELLPPLFDSSDIVKGSFGTQQDPQQLYTNRITARYAYHPASVETEENNKFLKVLTNSDYEGIYKAGAPVEQTINFMWLYLPQNVSEMVDNRLRFYGGPLDVVECDFAFRGLRLKLNDTIRLSFGPYEERECKVVGIRRNLSKGTTGVILYVYPDDVHAGLWTDETMNFPAHLGGGSMDEWDDDWTPEQKRYASRNAFYYCDEGGFLIPGKMGTKDRWGYA